MLSTRLSALRLCVTPVRKLITNYQSILLFIAVTAMLLPKQLLAQDIANSVIFNSADSNYLSRTPATAGNLRKWTYSVWVKRSTLTSNSPAFFGNAPNGASDNMSGYFTPTDAIQFYANNTTPVFVTKAVYRDPAHWYHIVFVWDTDNVTVTSRVRLYVDGDEVTTFLTDNRSALANRDSSWNKAILHYLAGSSNPVIDFNGYLSDVYFIDGQALTPSSFGEKHSATGKWMPKEYTGSYGTNGFHLDFTNSGDLGNDVSGNNNDWAVNNLDATDQVIDTPTNNFATLNILDAVGSVAVTNGGLNYSNVAGSQIRGSMGFGVTGKWYCEFTAGNAASSTNPQSWGISTVDGQITNNGAALRKAVYTYVTTSTVNAIYYYLDGVRQPPSGNQGLGITSVPAGATMQVAYDADTGNVWFGVNGQWSDGAGGVTGNPSTGVNPSVTIPTGDDMTVFLSNSGATYSGSLNCGQNAQTDLTYDANAGGYFKYAPPTGFKALSSANLPIPNILKPSDYFDVVTYTGNGSTQDITGLDFTPDLMWIKRRDVADYHTLWDTVRGATNSLSSDLTNGEASQGNAVTNLNVDGFTLGNDGIVNGNGGSYVAWNWKKEPTAGFDIVSYTGNGGIQHVPHSLGISPELYIIKNRSSAASWYVGGYPANPVFPGNNWALHLDTTAALADGSAAEASSSDLTLHTGAADTNASGDSYIAYLFASKTGFSKIGSYTGNGSVDGPFVYTGFKPAFVIMKRIDETGSWLIRDSAEGANPDNTKLHADSSGAEVTSTNVSLDYLSNGFKLRGTGAWMNNSGNSYVYIAFAKKPFGLSVDETPPQLSEIYAIPATTADTSPVYSFYSSEAGSITLGGSCSSTATIAVKGDNTITLDLAEGIYSDCAITVTDKAGNVSDPLGISTFTIDPDYQYTIANALEFNSGNGEYLSWTPVRVGNQTTWTWSAWVQRGDLGAINTLLYVSDGNQAAYIRLNSSNELEVALGDGSMHVYQSELFSDPSVWSHIALSVDTTQANAADRIKLYLNGELQTANAGYIDPQQNAITLVNSTNTHYVGNGGGSNYYDGSMAEVRLVDGIALDASAFGKETAQGAWVPVEYTSGGGSNSSYLSFENNTNLGLDSVNGNDWQVTGLDGDSQTAGTPTTPKVAGFIPGELSVGQGGDASYSIPIGVPAGVAGMQPELSINYNSNGGNGLLGMGFSLGGMSAVSRCPATIAQDGFRGGVYFNEKDRYCIDGQRLIAISGDNGADGTEYRTEIDSFSKIISYGQQGSGPSYWKVWTKSGQVIEYGNKADSAVKAYERNEVLFWGVNKIADTSGNYLDVFYDEEGGFHPIRIEYTGNASTGLVPKISVNFEYENSRPDPIANGFLSVATTVRLANIKTYVDGNNLVSDYKLNYQLSSSTNKSMLSTITQCDSNNNCLPVTSFNWLMDGENIFEQESYVLQSGFNPSVYSNQQYLPSDVNGDGRTDIVWVWNYQNQLGRVVYLANADGNGFTQASYVLQSGFNPSVYSNQQYLPSDVNGDGRTDIVWVWNYQNQLGRVVYLANEEGTGFTQVSYVLQNGFSPSVYSNQNYLPFDANGDGKTDIVWVWNYQNQLGRVIYLANADGTGFTQESYVLQNGFNPSVYSNQNYLPSDVNGDGKTDIVWAWNYQNQLGRVVYLANEEGVGFTQASYVLQNGFSPSAYSNQNYLPSDVNGDGKTDLVWAWNYQDQLGRVVYLANTDGTGFTQASYVLQSGFNPSAYSNQNYLPSDVNGDGKMDVVWVWNYQNQLGRVVYLANADGTGFTQESYVLQDGFNSSVYSNQQYLPSDVNGDGRTDILWAWNYQNQLGRVLFNGRSGHSDLLLGIKDGLGLITNIEYTPLTDSSIYTKDSGSSYPDVDLTMPAYVVSKVTSSDGLGGTLSTSYKYGGLKVNLLGRGSLGFAWMQATDDQTGIVTKTEYSQSFPYVGQVTRTEQRLADNTLLGETTASFNNTTSYSGKVYFPYTTQTIDKKYDLDGTLLATTTTDNVYDAFANPTRITVTTVDSTDTVVKDTQSDYINDTDVWHLGRLTRASVIHTNGQGSITRTSAFAYYPSGLLQTEIVEPDNPDLRLQTDYQYDSYGNKTQVTTSGQGIETRSSSTTYTADGRFPETVTNALGHTETRTYDPLLGVMTSLTGPNGLTTSWSYDGFGRQIREDRADGTWTTVTRGQCGVTACPEDAPTGTGLYTITESSGTSPVAVYSDQLGRETRTVKTGFDGSLIYEDVEYNHLGQIERKSQPYFKGDTAHWANSEYDILGRVKKASIQGPNNVIENTFSYSGYSSTATNAKGHVKTTYKNAQDQVIRVEEEEGGLVTYTYDATGNLLETNANGVITTLTYDISGRKKTMDDPDMGQWSYSYDVLGQLISQTDAKGQTTTMVYDKLGRMVQRDEPEGTSTWTYDTAANGIGSLAKVDGPNGYQQTISYDSLGRPSATSTSADGRTLTTSSEYDSYSRVIRSIRPQGFVLNNTYNDYGYLKAIYSPKSQIGDYDASHIRFLLDTAINDASTALTKAQEAADAALYYQQKAAEYQALSGTPELDAELEAQLQAIASELDAAAAILTTQTESYLDLAEQLIEVAEQLAAREEILLQRYAAAAENSNIDEYQAMADDSENVYFWRAKSRDAAGRLTSSLVGNGLETQQIYDQATGQLTDIISSFGYASPTRDLHYEYDDLNNVTSRVDRVLGMSESFEYDRQDRLTQSYVNGQIGDINYDYTQSYSYDAMGNMLYKSDIGNYTYGDQGRTTGNAGPHALISAGAAHTGYEYDLNGNMLQGGGRNITWSSFNKPIEFRKDGELKASFQYGPDRSRYLKVTPDSRTLYLDKAYERVDTGSKTEHKHFIYADGNLVAIHIKTEDNGEQQPDQTRYLHRDSLGSIDTITDGQGQIVDRMSYEAFGARRGGDWRAATGSIYIPALTNRGFTGHEHVDEMDLIHMNGRVYDPQLGRFLSADPTMQFPYSSQGYNRYSYVGNNPLKYTDPSGYGWFSKLFKKIKKFFKKVLSNPVVRLIGSAVAAMLLGPGGAWALTGSAFANGAIAGFAAGFIGSGGNFKAAIIGGISGGIAGYIGASSLGNVGKALAYGVNAGVSSILRGGKFISGFIDSFVRNYLVPKLDNWLYDKGIFQVNLTMKALKVTFDFSRYISNAVASTITSLINKVKVIDGIFASLAKSIGTDALMFGRLYMDGRGIYDGAMRLMKGYGVKTENTESYSHLHIIGSGRFDSTIMFGGSYFSQGQSNYDKLTIIGNFGMSGQTVQFKYETDRRYIQGMSDFTPEFDPFNNPLVNYLYGRSP